MKILSLNQTPCGETDTVFGVSSLRPAIATVCFCAMVAVAGHMAVYGRIGRLELPRLMAGVAGLFFLLFAWLSFRQWQAARRPTNWVMRVCGDEVLIKYRSYQNWPLSDDDPQVIALQRDEIEFVRASATTQVTRETGHGAQMTKLAYLEIGLKDSDTSALERALADEAARPGWGSKWQRTKYLDNPVQVIEKGVIRIAWNGTAAVRPGIKVALQTLEQIANVAEKRKDVEDFTATALKKLGNEEQKRSLADLARQDPVKAIEATRQLYGCSAGEAMQIVEDLMGGAGSQSNG